MVLGFPNVGFVAGAALWSVCACPKGLGWAIAGWPKGEADGGAAVVEGCPQLLVATGAWAKEIGVAGKDG